MDMQAQEQSSSNTGSEQRFSFTGTGSEYFRIWIVNLLLTILTLGIFSAWAKVRRMQYFYRNTHLGDSSFDYHGTPVAILKGRLIAVALFAAYSIAINFEPVAGLFILLFIVLIMPYFLVTSFRFRLYNTSFRGLRFGFLGSVKNAYVSFLALPIATLFTMYMLAPFTHHYIKTYQHNNSRFGNTPFTFKNCVGEFYQYYLIALAQYVAIVMVVIVLAAVAVIFSFQGRLSELAHDPKTWVAVFLGIYVLAILSSLLIVPYFISRIQNLIWNNTQLGENRFISFMTARGLAWIIFSNFIFTVLTLGLFKPFAAIRMARYRVEHMAVLAAGDINEFIAGEQQKAGAAGMETAEVFDIDIGF